MTLLPFRTPPIGIFSPAHWIIVLLMITPLMALLVVPTWRILHRGGFNGAWALLMLVPVVGLLVIWAIAFPKRPTDREARTPTSSAGLVAWVVLLLLPLALVTLVMLVNATFAQLLAQLRPLWIPQHHRAHPPWRRSSGSRCLP